MVVELTLFVLWEIEMHCLEKLFVRNYYNRDKNVV